MALPAPTGGAKPDSRSMLLIWIQAHVIKRFCPLSFGEDDSMQACLGAICKDEFPLLSLYSRNVKHKIVEMYAATADRFKQDFANHVSKAQLLHLTLDLWVDRCSSLKFIGEISETNERVAPRQSRSFTPCPPKAGGCSRERRCLLPSPRTMCKLDDCYGSVLSRCDFAVPHDHGGDLGSCWSNDACFFLAWYGIFIDHCNVGLVQDATHTLLLYYSSRTTGISMPKVFVTLLRTGRRTMLGKLADAR